MIDRRAIQATNGAIPHDRPPDDPATRRAIPMIDRRTIQATNGAIPMIDRVVLPAAV